MIISHVPKIKWITTINCDKSTIFSFSLLHSNLHAATNENSKRRQRRTFTHTWHIVERWNDIFIRPAASTMRISLQFHGSVISQFPLVYSSQNSTPHFGRLRGRELSNVFGFISDSFGMRQMEYLSFVLILRHCREWIRNGRRLESTFAPWVLVSILIRNATIRKSIAIDGRNECGIMIHESIDTFYLFWLLVFHIHILSHRSSKRIHSV